MSQDSFPIYETHVTATNYSSQQSCINFENSSHRSNITK
jgi:hypothetical protein